MREDVRFVSHYDITQAILHVTLMERVGTLGGVMGRARSPVTKTEYELLAEWRYALRRFLHFSERAAREAGLTPQWHQALLAIKGFAGRDHVSLGELAERLQIRHHSAVGLVDRLVARQLVQRKAAPDDRRRVHLQLTRQGETVLEKLATAHRRQLLHLGPQLGEILQRLQGAFETDD